jgi:hypothetical protein
MNICCEREGRRVVTEPHLHVLGIEASAEQDRCAGVPERVEADPAESGATSGGLQDSGGEVRRVEVCPVA